MRTGKQPDWVCPSPDCRNKNFGWREQCNRCQVYFASLLPSQMRSTFQHAWLCKVVHFGGPLLVFSPSPTACFLKLGDLL